MKFHERGLSVVEFVVALVALAVLASTAIPSVVDKDTKGGQSAVMDIAGSLGSASAINYAVRTISSSNGVAVANCRDVARALEGSLPTAYKIADISIEPGVTRSCTVTNRSGESAEFTGHGIS